MQNFFKHSKRLAAQFLLALTAAFLLAACSNPEKSDVIEISKVFSSNGYSPDTQQQFQQKMMSAKSEAEQAALIKEMTDRFEKTAADLEKTSLRSEEGRSARDHLAKGFKGIAVSTRKAIENAHADEKTQTAIAMEASEAQTEMMQGYAELTALAKKHNLTMGNDK
ncbi:MAG: hypothetical protein Q3966_03810 [Neisseria sp.]|nr:hypothetical protein [Neisseria sp.]